MCMVYLLVIPQRIVVFFFFYYMIDFSSEVSEAFVLSSEHKNQNVVTIGTLLDQFLLSCK